MLRTLIVTSLSVVVRIGYPPPQGGVTRTPRPLGTAGGEPLLLPPEPPLFPWHGVTTIVRAELGTE